MVLSFDNGMGEVVELGNQQQGTLTPPTGEGILDIDVELSIYDVSGRKIRTLVDGVRGAGAHRVEWNGVDESGQTVSAGVYYYKLRTAEGQWVRKMALLK